MPELPNHIPSCFKCRYACLEYSADTGLIVIYCQYNEDPRFTFACHFSLYLNLVHLNPFIPSWCPIQDWFEL